MSTLADLLNAVTAVREAIDRLHETTHHLEVIQFDEQQFLTTVSELAPVPKVNVARAVTAEQFRLLCNDIDKKARAIKLGLLTRKQLDELLELTAYLAFVANSAQFPVYRGFTDVEEGDDD